MKDIKIKKRNGELEPLNLEKITLALEYAKGDLKNVSVSEVEINSNLHFYDEMPSSEIHDILIKTCKNLTTPRTLNYSLMASHLTIQKIYKEAFGSTKRVSLVDMFKLNKAYNSEILDYYTNEELLELDSYIKDSRDFNFSIAGIDQLINKYMILDINTERITESPQLMFMAIAMDIFRFRKTRKMEFTKKMYDALSLFDISLPSPEMKALRTKSCDYASCITINMGDSIDSWTESKSAIIKHTVSSAGIGVDISGVASIGDKVKDGLISHAGKIPLAKAIDADIQTSTQNGRRGQAVIYYSFFDPEVVQILSLKSPRTETAKRINDLKYAIKLNDVFYERIKEGKNISLFSVREYPKLLELFNSANVEEFRSYYEELESKGVSKGYINARELMSLFISERIENGVYYILNIDEANRNNVYGESVTQSNICLEFISPTKPLSSLNRESPDIGVCILGNINQGTVNEKRLPEITELIVFAQNEIKDRQVHPTQQANEYVKQYASLGLGFANHSYFLAKNSVKYGSKEALLLHDRWMEHFQYGLIKASMEYAKERGYSAPMFYKNAYAKGLMPQDRYKKTVDELVQRELECDWDTLRKEVKEYGLWNCALSMIPPSETSSVIGGMTSSIEPIKDIITIKDTKEGNLIQVAPEALKLSDKYDYTFNRKDMTSSYIKHLAVTQKWIDMGISGNTFYNPELYEDKKIPEKQVMSDIFMLKKYGVKTLYYSNIYVEDEIENEDENCAGGGCSV